MFCTSIFFPKRLGNDSDQQPSVISSICIYELEDVCDATFHFTLLFVLYTFHLAYYSSFPFCKYTIGVDCLRPILTFFALLPQLMVLLKYFVGLTVTFGLTGTLSFSQQFSVSELLCLIIVVLRFSIVNFDCSLDLLIFLGSYWDSCIMGEYVKRNAVAFITLPSSFINAG